MDKGESISDQQSEEVVRDRIEKANQLHQGRALPTPHPSALGVTNTEDVQWLQRRLTPHPINAWLGTSHTDEEFELRRIQMVISSP